jgi:hypothetical protein
VGERRTVTLAIAVSVELQWIGSVHAPVARITDAVVVCVALPDLRQCHTHAAT